MSTKSKPTLSSSKGETTVAGRLMELIHNQITSERARVALGSSLVFGSVFALMLMFAILLYFVIYWSVMPEVVQMVNLSLDYTDPLKPVGILNCLEGGLFKAGSSYDLSLSLQVPESENNLGIGNFMAAITLATHEKVTLINRPVGLFFNVDALSLQIKLLEICGNELATDLVIARKVIGISNCHNEIGVQLSRTWQ